MTETTFSQANPAFAPHPHTDDVEPEVEVVEEFGNPEPIAEIVVEPEPEPEPDPEDPVDEDDPVLDIAYVDEPADQE